jgi:hypothetical protein
VGEHRQKIKGEENEEEENGKPRGQSWHIERLIRVEMTALAIKKGTVIRRLLSRSTISIEPTPLRQEFAANTSRA